MYVAWLYSLFNQLIWNPYYDFASVSSFQQGLSTIYISLGGDILLKIYSIRSFDRISLNFVAFHLFNSIASITFMISPCSMIQCSKPSPIARPKIGMALYLFPLDFLFNLIYNIFIYKFLFYTPPEQHVPPLSTCCLSTSSIEIIWF